jgi:hypothetical protein
MKNLKTNNRIAVLSTLAAALMMAFAVPSSAQDKKEAEKKEQQKVITTVKLTSPEKGKKTQNYVVTAKTTDNKDGKIKLHIIKEADGEKKVIDTTIEFTGQVDAEQLEKMCEKMNCKMKDLECKMKILEGFDYNFEMPDMPSPPCCPEQFGFWNHPVPSPGIQMWDMPRGEETLSDVLGEIPMSRVKSYKITDTKGGKKIVIEVEDGPMFGGRSDNMIYIKAPKAVRGHSTGKGHKQDYKVIIRSDGDKDDINIDAVPPPPPPPDPGKAKSDSTKI